MDKAHKANFGVCLGFGPGDVPVYSSDYDTADKAALPTREHYRSYLDGVFMGYKWQCVELARRWLYINKGYVFDDIAMAYDIFRLRDVTRIADGARLPLRSFLNGAKRRPEQGCLLIWNEGGEFDVTGHVAVVTEVFEESIRVIEQNIEDKVWPEDEKFSRELAVTIDGDGGYWIDCTYENAGIMGWVIQTDEDPHAVEIVDPDERLFDLQAATAAEDTVDAGDWLDPEVPDEAAYMHAMDGSRMSCDEADRGVYYKISETALAELKRATNELHAKFMHATNFVLRDDNLLERFNLPRALWPRIHQSWDNRRNEMITGRFDFTLSAAGLKVYEYNCDSASCHMETGKVQGLWAKRFGVDAGRCPGDSLHEGLVEAWKESGVDGVVHIMQDRDLEETYHALFMKSAMDEAGIATVIIKGISDLRWDDEGRVTDKDGRHIDWVWKTWAWETALDQIREQIDEDEENLRLHKTIDRHTIPPRLVDVLLTPSVMVFEPLWSLVPSNKAILPVLSSMYPEYKYLLRSSRTLDEKMAAGAYVVKPIVGRCGQNISIFDERQQLVDETGGQFNERDQIYQEFFPLPNLDGRNVQICTFTAEGSYAGACVRADRSNIITTDSAILPLRVVPDDDFAAAWK